MPIIAALIPSPLKFGEPFSIKPDFTGLKPGGRPHTTEDFKNIQNPGSLKQSDMQVMTKKGA